MDTKKAEGPTYEAAAKFRPSYVMGSIILLVTIGSIGAGVVLGRLNQESKMTCRAAIQADIRGILERFSREQVALKYYDQQETKVTAALALPITVETNAEFGRLGSQARVAGEAFRRIAEEPRANLLADTACPPLWLNN